MQTRIEKKLTKTKAVLALILAGIISVIIAVAWVEYGAIELGAIFYFIVPVIVTIVTIIAFFLIDSFISVNRKQLTLILAIIILLTGIFMRLDFYYGIID